MAFTCVALLVGALAVIATPAQADVVCTKSADPASHGGLQALLNKVRDAGSADPVACIPSGTYSINFALVIPITMRVIGVGSTPPVISCSAATYCFDGTGGPSGVTLRDLSLDGAHKADVQIGSGADGVPLVTGWTLTGITATGAGQVGIAMNNASDITISGATISQNGSTPYDADSNPTGDFGLRANRVDGLTLQDSIIADNPTVPSPNPGFAGGAKFNTSTNLLVQRNHFSGNGGGGQLWVDISSHDFDLNNNTIDEVPTAGTGLLPNDAIRVEVSCAGMGGSFVRNNVLTGGVVAAIDIYDSRGITVQNNAIVVPKGASFGVRMFGNVHDPVPDTGCQQAGAFPNSNNVAVGNTIDMSSTAAALNGVKTIEGGTSSGNAWSSNGYTVRHCDPDQGGQWLWWDGVANQVLGYAGWRGIGQDVDAGSTCTSIYPQVDSGAPFEPSWGPEGTIVVVHGSGFANVTSVRFNSIAATFSHDDDAIIATVPDGASTGPVCVKNALNTTCSTTAFVVAPGVGLTVAKVGTGEGRVTSLVPNEGVDCGAVCEAEFPVGASVTLHATPEDGSTFAGWSGACSGMGPCDVTMDAAKTVIGTFIQGAISLPERNIAYNGWFAVADAAASGGSYRMSDLKNDSVRWKSPPTTSLTWVTRTGPDQGRASITIDGKSKGIVDLYAASPAPLSKVYAALTNKAHTVVIKVLHTKDAASHGFSVRIDAFVAGAHITQESRTAVQYATWTSTAQARAADGTYRSAMDSRATVTVSFSGTSIDWKTTKGRAYGRASVKIDGVNEGIFDMYQGTTAWQSVIAFAGLSPGPHTMVIHVLGTKDPSATGTKVVVDGFAVYA